MNRFAIIILVVGLNAASSRALHCPVCGMNFSEKAKTRFEVGLPDKKVTVCSFACAHKLNHKQKGAKISGHDFFSDESVDVRTAFFLTRSSKLVKKLDFNMAPTVATFKEAKSAEVLKTELNEGVIVNGWEKLEGLYE